jgi:hypothetical protein
MIRSRIDVMMRNHFPGWPPDGLEIIIYEAPDTTGLPDLITHFVDELPGGLRSPYADSVLGVVQDAWNYLPHKSLGGLSPAEILFRNGR